MYTTRSLAEHVYGTRTKELLAEGKDAALRCVLDLMTAVITGLKTPSAEGTRSAARILYGKGAAAIWFMGSTATSAGAALSNSAAASALDLDDGHRLARGHPGAAVVPAAFGMAEEVGATAEELLAAIVVGYDVGVRIAAGRGTHGSSGLWCGYAAAAAAGRLRRTAPEQLSHAFAITAANIPNLIAADHTTHTGNDVKEGIPWSTVAGMSALYLAEAGLTGPEDVLDQVPHYTSDRILDNLGHHLAICTTYFKPYSCCRHIHPAIDALEELKARHSFSADEIVAIEVHTFDWALQLPNRNNPDTLVDVQYSIPYCIALSVLLGSTVLLPIEASVLNRPEVTNFASKVTLHVDPDLDIKFPGETLARVVVVTAENRFESPATTPRGEPSNPMSWTDLEDKFRIATRKIMAAPQQQELLGAVERLRGGKLDPLLRILQRPIGSGRTDHHPSVLYTPSE